ncbi:hypothetical protein [Virgibacillus proomii]|uniref:hypothetical protein n=1 Tax=Virgibacillus proomii TaxID=84407 RepID=UPI001C12465B|nr:hypothetical protein [Virgibacillus proomii]MBU5266292.1 hypothetical protein [Virgibacillus proomii]
MADKAIFETLPNYEYTRDGFHIVFNGEGLYVTNNASHIAVLEKAKPFIKRIDDGQQAGEEESYPEHVGGGMYVLSNGEKVKGKKAAEQAESTLEK